jgi:glutamate racemase
MRKQPIGVFDSGMGGLTVLRALRDRLPHESFVYLGDTARLPYGTKSGETVSRYALQAAAALMNHDIKLLVIACNTASAHALPTLQKSSPVPVVGVIGPGAQAAVAAAPQGPIAVIATEGTVKDGSYARAIRALAPDIEVMQQPCPLFVPLAEEGLTGGDIPLAVARHYLTALRERRPKCLVLGCTHFPVLKNVIAETIGSDVALVDSAETTALAVQQVLRESDLLDHSSGAGATHYLVTDTPERFVRVGKIFLGASIDPALVELIDLQ